MCGSEWGVYLEGGGGGLTGLRPPMPQSSASSLSICGTQNPAWINLCVASDLVSSSTYVAVQLADPRADIRTKQ